MTVERHFRQRIDQIKTEQLRVGKALHRLGADVAAISSTISQAAGGGAQRSYTAESASATW